MSRAGDPDVAVIGGGIVGVSAAALLAAAGASVTIYEREALGAGASGRNSGVVQWPFDPLLLDLYRASVDLYRELGREDAGFRLPDEPSGLLLVGLDPGVVRSVAAHLARAFPSLGPETFEGPDVQEIEPCLAPGVAACRIPVGYPIAPAAPTYAFATLAERRGVRLRLGREARPIVAHGRASGVLVDGRLEPAGAVLVAAGPWSAALLDPSGRWRPVRPVWGVVVETLMASPPHHVLEEAGIDELLAGAGADEVGSDASAAPEVSVVTAAGVSAVGSTFLATEPDLASWQTRVLQHAATFVPAVMDAQIRGVRACARPASVDGRPLLGPVPGIDGLFLATGHGPWGISTGPGSARLVADAILGRPVAIPRELAAARFGSPT